MKSRIDSSILQRVGNTPLLELKGIVRRQLFGKRTSREEHLGRHLLAPV